MDISNVKSIPHNLCNYRQISEHLNLFFNVTYIPMNQVYLEEIFRFFSPDGYDLIECTSLSMAELTWNKVPTVPANSGSALHREREICVRLILIYFFLDEGFLIKMTWVSFCSYAITLLEIVTWSDPILVRVYWTYFQVNHQGVCFSIAQQRTVCPIRVENNVVSDLFIYV